jgi:hypothetical protein
VCPAAAFYFIYSRLIRIEGATKRPKKPVKLAFVLFLCFWFALPV